MEQVALNNVQLDYLARDDPQLKLYFYGTVACDRLWFRVPSVSSKVQTSCLNDTLL